MIEEIQIGTLLIKCDPDRTRNIYAGFDPQPCDCTYCRNFAAAHPALPDNMIEALRLLGINATKPNEIVEYGPDAKGRHYGVEWAFIGPVRPGQELQVVRTLEGGFEDGRRFDVYPGGIPNSLFADAERWSIEMYFREVPWLLPEPEPQ